MAVIPITRGAAPAQPAQAQPSETAMLMALAEMHKQGRFDPPNQQLALATGDREQGPGGKSPLQLPFDPMVEQNLKLHGLTDDPAARSEAYKRHVPKD